MPQSTAKLYVSAVNVSSNGPDQQKYATIHFNVVYSSKFNTEDNSFWRATPNGSLKLQGKYEILERFCQPGKRFYLHIERMALPEELRSASHKDKFQWIVGYERETHPADGVMKYARVVNIGYEGAERLNVRMVNMQADISLSIDNARAWGLYEDGLYAVMKYEFEEAGEEPV